MTHTEKWLDNKTEELLTKLGYVFFKVHGNEYQRSGIADFLAYKDGQLVLIENKHPNKTGNLKALQYMVLSDYSKQGAISICSDDIEYTEQILTLNKPGLYVMEKYEKQALKGLAQCYTQSNKKS